MRKRMVAVAFAGAILLLPLPSASAGGSVFEFSHRFELVGAQVQVESHFSKGTQASVTKGPWFGYITTRDVTFYSQASIRASVPLGSVTITRGKCCPWVAHMTFTVPELPTGRYYIMVCDAGCHRGVGDLAGGSIVIAQTPTEGRLFLKAEREQIRIAWLSRQLGRSKAHAEVVVTQLETTRAALSREDARLAALEDRAREPARGTSSGGPAWPIVAWVGALLTLGLLIICLTWLVRVRNVSARTAEPVEAQASTPPTQQEGLRTLVSKRYARDSRAALPASRNRSSGNRA